MCAYDGSFATVFHCVVRASLRGEGETPPLVSPRYRAARLLQLLFYYSEMETKTSPRKETVLRSARGAKDETPETRLHFHCRANCVSRRRWRHGPVRESFAIVVPGLSFSRFFFATDARVTRLYALFMSDASSTTDICRCCVGGRAGGKGSLFV
ncbi:hypothetical protein MRX96_028152 [Rhipicephalus microplus]